MVYRSIAERPPASRLLVSPRGLCRWRSQASAHEGLRAAACGDRWMNDVVGGAQAARVDEEEWPRHATALAGAWRAASTRV